jgi:hypothetical protein
MDRLMKERQMGKHTGKKAYRQKDRHKKEWTDRLKAGKTKGHQT